VHSVLKKTSSKLVKSIRRAASKAHDQPPDLYSTTQQVLSLAVRLNSLQLATTCFTVLGNKPHLALTHDLLETLLTAVAWNPVALLPSALQCFRKLHTPCDHGLHASLLATFKAPVISILSANFGRDMRDGLAAFAGFAWWLFRVDHEDMEAAIIMALCRADKYMHSIVMDVANRSTAPNPSITRALLLWISWVGQQHLTRPAVQTSIPNPIANPISNTDTNTDTATNTNTDTTTITSSHALASGSSVDTCLKKDVVSLGEEGGSGVVVAVADHPLGMCKVLPASGAGLGLCSDTGTMSDLGYGSASEGGSRSSSPALVGSGYFA
jgi:hypothetical protein